ncbi:MAG: hypothetical protein HQL87_18325 [Magnetococcales bacterium]|nr:hypothetical protein [Magnetococcales bacterium]
MPATIHWDYLPALNDPLFGREPSLWALDLAWTEQTWPIVVLVADSGLGKTGLVMEWLHRISQKQFGGAEWVFGWSFGGQSTPQDRQASADEFLHAGLKFFGKVADQYPDALARGERLATLMGKRRGLLVLDGLEPLQYPQSGGLRDLGMEAFLHGLASHNKGLCIVTTRTRLPPWLDAKGVQQSTLEPLTVQAGAALLASYPLQTTQKELEKVAGECNGHPLALHLLAAHLVTAHGGNIRRRHKLPLLPGDGAQGGLASRVLASQHIGLQGKSELALLYLLGLFDHPAPVEALQAVIGKTPLEGLPVRLPKLGSKEWLRAVAALRQRHLLAVTDPLACHPLVRAYFGAQFRTHHPAAWQEANRRLFDHFCTLPGQTLPDTQEGLLPLYRAIPHGCQAGLPQQALHAVYRTRIAREKEQYAIKKLGVYGLEVGAMAAFFAQPWSRPAAGLSETDVAYLLTQTAFGLWVGGCLQEAIQPYATLLMLRIQAQAWENAAITASNMGELSLLCTDLPQSIAFATLAVDLVDATGDAAYAIDFRTLCAEALHQAGGWEQAEALFHAAETRQGQRQPAFPLLHAVQGYRYNELLLAQKQYQRVWDRTQTTLTWDTEEIGLLGIALDQLALGQACIGLGVWQEAGVWLDRAVAGLWQAGSRHRIPSGFMARAGWHRRQQAWALARRDLDAAWENSQHGRMTLFDVPLHLEESELALAQGETAQARHHLAQAQGLIQQTGLFRFAEQADALGQQLGEPPAVWDRSVIEEQICEGMVDIFRQYFPPKPQGAREHPAWRFIHWLGSSLRPFLGGRQPH